MQYCIAGFGGVQAATLASTSRPTGQERCPESRYALCTNRYPQAEIPTHILHIWFFANAEIQQENTKRVKFIHHNLVIILTLIP